jgi:predicted aldo/keto reductase-like oxidoreductase
MRYHMYFKEYGLEKHAMESYAGLDSKAHTCESCVDNTCSTACPYELPVGKLLARAHNNLTFMA